MRDELAKLEELQNLDIEILALERKKDGVPGQMEEQISRLQELGTEKEDVTASHESQEKQKTEYERELELQRMTHRNRKNKESMIASRKEYEAYIKEMDTLERMIKELDAKLKESDALLSADQEQLTKLTAEEKILQKEIGDAKARLDANAKKIDNTLESLYDKRDALEDKIQENLLDHYIRISEKKFDGKAIAYARDGHCMSCNMAVPPQMYNELLRGDLLHACPSCQRLLIYRELLPGETAELEEGENAK